jgi:hypothetical protein
VVAAVQAVVALQELVLHNQDQLGVEVVEVLQQIMQLVHQAVLVVVEAGVAAVLDSAELVALAVVLVGLMAVVLLHLTGGMAEAGAVSTQQALPQEAAALAQ